MFSAVCYAVCLTFCFYFCMWLRLYIMKAVLEKWLCNGFMCRKFTDDDSESEQESNTRPAGYYEEQEAIRQRLYLYTCTTVRGQPVLGCYLNLLQSS